jgi:hypothetical protein
MSISAVCACDAQIEATDDLAGQSVKCPQCAASVFIPVPSAGAEVSARTENYWEDAQVPADLKEKALAELTSNEQLVWVGQPVGAIVFRRSLGYLVLGGLVTVVSLLWLLGAFSQKPAVQAAAPGKNAAPQQRAKAPAAAAQRLAKAPPAAAQEQAKAPPAAKHVDPLPAIILGVSACCMCVPFFRWRSAKRTCYALTTRRALVYKEGLFSPTRESYSPVEVAKMRRSNSWLFRDGGDLIFRSVTVVRTSYQRQTGFSRSVKTTHYGFLAIAHIRDVEKIVRETLIDRFVDKLCEAGAF